MYYIVQLWNLAKKKKERSTHNYLDLCGSFSTTSSKGNKHIYLMYVYECNFVLTTVMKNRSDKGIIRAFREYTFEIQPVNQAKNPIICFQPIRSQYLTDKSENNLK